MDQLERFERDYQMGRLAGMSEALAFISSVTDGLPVAERALISEKVWGPLYRDLQRLRRRSPAAVDVARVIQDGSAGRAMRIGLDDVDSSPVPLPRVDRAGVPSDPARSVGGG